MELTSKVIRVMKGENISPEELHHMMQHAALCRIGDFNRRYFHWLFRIHGNVLLDMRHLDMVIVGHGTVKVYEEHEDCEGNGCKDCGWIGSICRMVTDLTNVGLHVE